MATATNNKALLNNQRVVTGTQVDYSNTQNDKYCLELQTTLKGKKLRMAKSPIVN